jgi:SNF2 family DNA or RNA helicase
MNINVGKLLCMISMKKSESKCLSIEWIRCLHNLMQTNKELLNFIRRKNYGNIYLDDLSEWVSIDYFANFKEDQLKYYRMPNPDDGLPKIELVDYHNIKLMHPTTGRENYVRLTQMPYVYRPYSYSSNPDGLSKIKGIECDTLRMVNGKLEFIFRLNKNTILNDDSPFYKGYNQSAYRDTNKKRIRHLLQLGCQNDSRIVNMITPHVKRVLKGTKYAIPSPLTSTPPLTITLKEYQKENIRWMLKVEKESPLTIPYTPGIPISDGKIWINPLSNTFSEMRPDKKELNIYGGVILDTVGMGKTIVSLVASLMNPALNVGTPDKKVIQKYHRPCIALIESKGSKRKGQLCGKKSIDNMHGFCKTHLKSKINSGELKIDENIPIEVYNEENVNYILDTKLNLFKSRATLIIVTNTLPSRWLSEMNLLKNRWDINILQIISRHDYETISYKDVINADFIITTFDFMTFNSGFQNNTTMKDRMSDINSVKPNDYISILETKKPYFFHFYWNRVIVDEIHTVDTDKFRNSNLKQSLCHLKANFKWCLSGSAFINNLGSYTFMLDYLYTARSNYDEDIKDKTDVDLNEQDDVQSHLQRRANRESLRKKYLFLKHYHHMNIFKNCFRCNTYESANKEISFDKPLIEKNYFVELSSFENALYKTRLAKHNARDNANDECLRQICCHPRLNAHMNKNVEHLNASLKDIYKQTYKDLIISISESESKIKNLQESVLYFTNELSRYGGFGKVSQTNWAKIGLKKERTSLTRETNMLTRMNEAKKAFSINTKKNTTPSLDESVDYTINDSLIGKHGTKLTHLLAFMKKEFTLHDDTKYIIFSQWESYITLISNALKENGIPAYCCKGNVFQKRKAVKMFKESSNEKSNEKSNDTVKISTKKPKEDYRVILLSLKSADSGLDFPEANNVILMDWIKGTNTYKKCIKTQAAGRARRMGQNKSVNVIHFITKNTIDEEMMIDEDESSDEGDVCENIEMREAFDDKIGGSVKII